MYGYMLIAYEEAEKAYMRGEVPVGAVIVKDGSVIARAGNECEKSGDPLAHAEMLAIRRAQAVTGSGRLAGCEMYVTLEPCPMCAGAIAHSGISKTVFGAYDTELGAFGSYINIANSPGASGMEVYGGIMESECSGLIKEFFKNVRTGKE